MVCVCTLIFVPLAGWRNTHTTNIMNTIDYIGLTDINAYLAPEHPFAEQNGDIIRQLTSGSECGLYEPLFFLNLLHAKFALVRANRLEEEPVLEHLRSLEMGYGQRHYLYYCLKELIGEYIKTAPKDCRRGMQNCKSDIEAELRRIWTERHEPEKHRQEMERKYSFERNEKQLKNYDPIKDLDAYMDTPLNLDIFWMLTERKEWECIIHPLTFYKLLYRQFEIVCDNIERPLALRTHLLGLGLDENQLYLFLHYLIVLLKARPNTTKAGVDTKQHLICLGILDREYQKLSEQRTKENKPLIQENSNDENKVLEGSGSAKQGFALSTKNGTKTDLVRLLNAIYHLKLIYTKDGMLPTKDEFMRSFGQFLGTDLEGYSVMLSRAVNSTGVEANMKVFRELSEFMETLLNKGLEDPKR